MEATQQLRSEVGARAACAALGLARSSFYRRGRLASEREPRKRPMPARALGAIERDAVLETLHAPRFVDKSPAQVFATLLDEDVYLCGVRTMYRVLAANAEVRERRRQTRHPAYAAPELIATAPNQVWSWDITKLKGPAKWVYYYLYVVLDIFSRRTVGWMIAEHENADLAQRLIAETYEKQGIKPGQLTLHADRGSPMKAKPMAQLLADLSVTRTHSRPHVSNDNPFSEAQFKTLKYSPQFPTRFGSLEDAKAFARTFFTWYNTEHRHSGIGYLTPDTVHHGHAAERLAARQETLRRAYDANPERFVNGVPRAAALQQAVWINPPKPGGEPLIVTH
jgi:putative transposase